MHSAQFTSHFMFWLLINAFSFWNRLLDGRRSSMFYNRCTSASALAFADLVEAKLSL